MAIAKFFLIALLFATVALAQNEDKRVIDEFTVEQGPFVFVTVGGGAGDSDNSVVDDDGSSSILGTERDFLYEIDNIQNGNLVFSAGCSGGEFTQAAPRVNQQGILGSVDIQWDGTDGDATAVDPSGLGGLDFTADLANQFHISAKADFAFDAEIRVYSGGAPCTGTFTIPAGEQFSDIFLAFSSFSSGCDFTNIGAVQLFVEVTDNLDLTVDFLRTNGPIPASPSNTPAPTPSATSTVTPTTTPSTDPSASRTPTPTPSQTPSPSPIIDDDECYCVCPAFRCELFRSDDEDGGIVGYRSISDEYWNWYGFPSSVIYDFFSTVA